MTGLQQDRGCHRIVRRAVHQCKDTRSEQVSYAGGGKKAGATVGVTFRYVGNAGRSDPCAAERFVGRGRRQAAGGSGAWGGCRGSRGRSDSSRSTQIMIDSCLLQIYHSTQLPRGQERRSEPAREGTDVGTGPGSATVGHEAPPPITSINV